MPYVNQGIFRINSNRYYEVAYQYRNFQKKLSKIKKDNTQDEIRKLLKEAKKFKKDLNNFRYEFKGFLDTVKCVTGSKQVKYEEMFDNIIEIYINTRRLVKQVEDLIKDDIIKNPVKIVRRA